MILSNNVQMKKMVKNSRKDNITYCAIDVETSGFSPVRGDRVIECAAVKINNGEIVSEFSTLINVPCPIHPGAKQVHGITRKMLIEQPYPQEAWMRFLDFIGNAPLIAHNAKFDMGFIRMELRKLKLKISNRCICTLQLARKHFHQIPNHRLESVARHILGKIPADCFLHRALGDARLVARVWMAMERKR